MKDTLVSLYDFYLKCNEVGEDTRHQQDVNASDDMPNTLARFKKHLEEEDSVESRNEVKRYLIDGCEDPNDYKLDILGQLKSDASKYKILSKVLQHVLVISITITAFKSAFCTSNHMLDQF